jgi:hypothetical protein
MKREKKVQIKIGNKYVGSPDGLTYQCTFVPEGDGAVYLFRKVGGDLYDAIGIYKDDVTGLKNLKPVIEEGFKFDYSDTLYTVTETPSVDSAWIDVSWQEDNGTIKKGVVGPKWLDKLLGATAPAVVKKKPRCINPPLVV